MTFFVVVGIPLAGLLYVYVIKHIIKKLKE